LNKGTDREARSLDGVDVGGEERGAGGVKGGGSTGSQVVYRGESGGGNGGRQASMCGFPLGDEEVKDVTWSKAGEASVGQLVAVRRRNGRMVYGLIHDVLWSHDNQMLLDVTVQSTHGPGTGGGRLRKVLPPYLVGILGAKQGEWNQGQRGREAHCDKAYIDCESPAQTALCTSDDARERLLREAVRRRPDDLRANCELGRLCHARNKLQDAEHYLRAALRADPDDHVALTCYGRLLMVLGDAEYASNLFRKAGVAISFGTGVNWDQPTQSAASSMVPSRLLKPIGDQGEDCWSIIGSAD